MSVLNYPERFKKVEQLTPLQAFELGRSVGCCNSYYSCEACHVVSCCGPACDCEGRKIGGITDAAFNLLVSEACLP